MKQTVIHTIFCITCALLTALWAYAALSKWSEFTQFADQLKRQPLPVWSIPLFKWGLPATELTTALLICFQRTRLKGLVLSFFLMLLFTLYVLFALTGAFGEIPCSCAGLIAALGWKGHLVFNIIFTIASLAGIFLFHATGKGFSQGLRRTEIRADNKNNNNYAHNGKEAENP